MPMNAASPAPNDAPLLIELFTEELPPKALQRLADSFATQIADALAARGLALPGSTTTPFGTPRRLAVRLSRVVRQAADRTVELKGPSTKVGLGADGQPTQALVKWAEKQGVTIDALHRGSDGKQECFFARSLVRGDRLDDAVGPVIDAALAKLPIPKLMQYQLADGRTTVSFVRPAHRLTVLHGAEVLPASVLGLAAGRRTLGHRFQCDAPIDLAHADDYERVLEQPGRVIASIDARRARIEAALRAQAASLGASLGDEAAVTPLLDEVTALVEWPAVYVGEFESAFLEVPQECLILTMRTNQKYFPLFDAGGRLLPKFLIVSNMDVADPRFIIDGNQRVVRPRLADARFFYQQDRRTRLADRLPQLASVVYHAKLGTQAQRVDRVRQIARAVAGTLGADATLADRAARLAKTDLLTGMVGEFPELQGVMGRYYAQHDGEPAPVADAIQEQYQPRFAGDALPAGEVGTVLAIADKMETLAGLFGIGQLPTGDKDPFALRRHALGVLRMLIEKQLQLPVDGLLDAAFAAFPDAQPAARPALADFLYERLAGYLRERGWSPAETGSVVDQRPVRLDLVPMRLEAVRAFAGLPQAAALAAANKRIGNLLRKTEIAPDAAIEPALLTEPAEQALHALLGRLAPQVQDCVARLDFTGALSAVAQAREPVDAFFNDVMVMAEDAKVRNNRLALLARLRTLMNQVADISRLSAA
jgi:glycyl-tRNA synthetase beta chain